MENNIQRLISNIEKTIKGKKEHISLVITALLAKGHILLEDNPGSGKTMLARALANSISSVATSSDHHHLGFKRIQFTPDLLPMDLLGTHIFDDQKKDFIFKKGPLFTNILLADDGSPHSQAAIRMLCDLPLPAETKITAITVFTPLQSSDHARFRQSLEITRACLLDKGLSVSTELQLGYPAEHHSRLQNLD